MLGNVGPWQLLLILAIALVFVGTKKLRNVGSDLGTAVKGFKDAMKDEKTDAAPTLKDDTQAQTNVEQKTEKTQKEQA